MARQIITGPNFSGRSAMLLEHLATGDGPGRTFLLGPYAEAALSGLANTVADEIDIYRSRPEPAGRSPFTPMDFSRFAARKPPTLSGGEQILLALHCFSLSKYRAIGIDTALEQLDPSNRAQAFDYLGRGGTDNFDVTLIDNRAESLAGWSHVEATARTSDFACDLARLMARVKPAGAPSIGVAHLSFRYTHGRDIFNDANVTLDGGRAYRLVGANGAGKTTFCKILAGVLVPAAGTITLGIKPYTPWHDGSRLLALATQNPDHQCCGATLSEDLARRRSALTRFGEIMMPGDDTLAALAGLLGIHSLDQHLYELPLAARKRVSWLLPLSGILPWSMFDEPSIGQDRETRRALAAAMTQLCALGRGVVFITHDDEFAAWVAHQRLEIADGAITT